MPITKFEVDINGRLADPEFAREYVAVLNEEITGHRKRIAELEAALRNWLENYGGTDPLVVPVPRYQIERLLK